MSKISLLALTTLAVSLSYSITADAVEAQNNNSSLKNQCEALKTNPPFNTVITRAKWIEKGKLPPDPMSAMTGAASRIADVEMPAHCLIQGEMEKRTGANGADLGTVFQLRLPENWNHKFLFQGGGGMDGFIAPAVGGTPIQGSTAIPGLARGYAVVSSNGGHTGLDAAFAADQQARLDLGFASIGKVTDRAKQLIQAFYQQKPQKSYFMGCSNGGREAMMAAQRFPLEFDGVVAANPGFRLAKAAIAELWDNHQFYQIAPKNKTGNKIFANALTQKDLDIVAQGVLNHCDAKDGLKDGIINAWERCDFEPEMVEKELGKEKVAIIKAVFNGPKNSNGETLYASWPYDAGINGANWRSWKLGTSQTEQPNALNATIGGAVGAVFFTPAQTKMDIFNANFDTADAQTDEVAGFFNADKTDLSTFAGKGGKMIIVQGVSDPVFSTNDIKTWYQKLLQSNQKTKATARVFMVPGMNHCGGGPALDNLDPLSALENWAEKGQEPNHLIATGKAFPNKSQPICAYPKVATYIGGDKNKAESFECKELQ